MGCSSSTAAARASTGKDAPPVKEAVDKTPKADAVKTGDVKIEVLDPKLSKDVKLADKFEMDMKSKLGSGFFSTVRLGRDKATGRDVAIKCIDEKNLSEEDRIALKDETELLYKLDHPHIIKFYGFFHEKNMYYIVTEYVAGGELFDRIVAKECYSEKDAQAVVRTIAETIKYCHDNNVVHRDLKPENILLNKEGDNIIDDDIKLVDFGFAKMNNPTGLKTACGTPGYVAPEILKAKSYGKSVDVWSFGVIIYIMLCGYPPFIAEGGEGQAELFKKIKKGEYTFLPEYWSHISDSAKDLIRKTLRVDPKERITIGQMLEHEWLKGSVSDETMTGTLKELKKFQAKRRWKSSVTAVKAANRMAKLVAQNNTSSSNDPPTPTATPAESPKPAEAEVTSS